MKRIDAHQHFWRLADRAGSWPPAELEAIYRDFLPQDLEPQLAAHGMAGTVLVQSLPSVADTRFLLQLAKASPFVLGVVGWVDLKATDAASQIAALEKAAADKGTATAATTTKGKRQDAPAPSDDLDLSALQQLQSALGEVARSRISEAFF